MMNKINKVFQNDNELRCHLNILNIYQKYHIFASQYIAAYRLYWSGKQAWNIYEKYSIVTF